MQTPLRDKVRQLYTQKAGLYRFCFYGVFRYGRGVAAHLAQSGLIASDLRILDAGCGHGDVMKACLRIADQRKYVGVSLFAFDLTPAMLAELEAWAAQQASIPIQTQVADILEPDQLPPSWTHMDRIICSAMLEYVPRERLAEALGNLRARLAPGGHLLVYITRRNWLTRWLIARWWAANIYTPAKVEEALRHAGFQSITFTRFPFPYAYLNLAMMAVHATAR
ncbi:MAG: class I SAM-dependent methyltransferase [Candidatus Hydrogenedentes bacterium]|nr:class I SAM-dependent methyltransferase [Candidatus Hydrogenedentota bacterium]